MATDQVSLFLDALRGKLHFDEPSLAFCTHFSWFGAVNRDRLGIEYLAGRGREVPHGDMERALLRIPAVAAAVGSGTLIFGPMNRVQAFSPSHTVKRTISDLRGSTS